jgi:hypothetical protein
MKMRDRWDGFSMFFPEATPSFEDPGVKNLDRQMPGVHVGCIVSRSQKIRTVVDPPMDLYQRRMRFG